MPPEQLMGNPVPASDIYALAAVIVYMISGKSPADMPVKDFHLIFEPDMPNAPQILIATLNQMLEPDVTRRISDPAQLIELFNRMAQDGDGSNALVKKYWEMLDKYQEEAEKKKYYQQLIDFSDYNQPGSMDLFKKLSASGLPNGSWLAFLYSDESIK